jgi:hypothetical protein
VWLATLATEVGKVVNVRFNPMIDYKRWKNAREERIDGANATGDDHSAQKQRRSPSDGQGSTDPVIYN